MSILHFQNENVAKKITGPLFEGINGVNESIHLYNSSIILFVRQNIIVTVYCTIVDTVYVGRLTYKQLSRSNII